jgi:hypothetical protein
MEISIRSADQVLHRLTGLELGQPDGDRRVLGHREARVDAREPLLGHRHIDVRHPADELVATDANDQVVATEAGLERVDDPPQQVISGGVAERVVDGVEAVDVDERTASRSVGLGSLRAATRSSRNRDDTSP